MVLIEFVNCLKATRSGTYENNEQKEGRSKVSKAV
ncbi:hypothetical protein HDEF_2082 [Candidatus Hamiltonella defensa 5AT (Acyrthosiphon pisum)]|uniref:Uncharacterized protein n=1 Tax=Hamiltonella defensa subsp. Acyrthosiphon pisum (strain 5AT) TaxID=572265 RepID=C4K7V5_HAMD5|nr:hypothetical protein HDEF_2082 [Candidatus Hamiltonella defensa 5AT (Acyrthosiphon pisum)]